MSVFMFLLLIRLARALDFHTLLIKVSIINFNSLTYIKQTIINFNSLTYIKQTCYALEYENFNPGKKNEK
jgi:hypothetical protein